MVAGGFEPPEAVITVIISVLFCFALIAERSEDGSRGF